MPNQGEEGGVDKKGPTEASLPNSQKSNSNDESIIGKSLHVQQLLHIQKLIGMMRSLLSNTSVVFNAVHEEIAAIVARYLDEGGCDSPFLARDPGNAPSPEETARNGRLLTVQLNLARLFNPSILTGGVFSTMSEDLKALFYQDSMLGLHMGVYNALMYLLSGIERLLLVLSPLLDCIAAEPNNEQVWLEMTLYQQSLVDFVRQVLHPRLFQELSPRLIQMSAPLNEDGNQGDDDAQKTVVQKEEKQSKQWEKDGKDEK